MFHFIRVQSSIASAMKGVSPYHRGSQRITAAWVKDIDPELVFEGSEEDDRHPLLRRDTSTSASTSSRPKADEAAAPLGQQIPAWVRELDPDLEMDPRWALETMRKVNFIPNTQGLRSYDITKLRILIKNSHSES